MRFSIQTFSVLFCLAASLAPAAAEAPIAKMQPGFYRMVLGGFEVTALNDGVIGYGMKQVLPDVPDDQLAAYLADNFQSDPFPMSYNGFLINTGTRLVLIDVGTGGKMADNALFRGAGRLLANLRAAGYSPDQVDEVYVTHRGPDHVGGLTIGMLRAFPNAIVRAPRAEFDMFVDPGKVEAALAQAKDPMIREWLQATRNLFLPYIEAGRFQAFEGDGVLTPGIRSLAAHGHTPGHTAYVVESEGQQMIVAGDLILSELQLLSPSLESRFDADPKAAAAQRVRILDMAADGKAWVAGGHLSFPGLGHVRREGSGYRLVPPAYAIP